MKRSAAIAVTMAALFSVAIPSAYAADKAPAYRAASGPNTPGYFVEPPENGRYAIGFTGDRGMSRAQVAQFALLRAAEFTTEQGQDWFAVLRTRTQRVQGAEAPDLETREGHFIGSEAQTGDTSADALSVHDNTPHFGGTTVPNGMLERWTPPSVYQTILTIQMGSGDKASFQGVVKTPQIFSAKDVAAEIRAKMGVK